ncbi:MAG: hypothetical protein ACYTGA_09245 [Planctomycetota bacterium]|jgi:hypothetical protein
MLVRGLALTIGPVRKSPQDAGSDVLANPLPLRVLPLDRGRAVKQVDRRLAGTGRRVRIKKAVSFIAITDGLA